MSSPKRRKTMALQRNTSTEDNVTPDAELVENWLLKEPVHNHEMEITTMTSNDGGLTMTGNHNTIYHNCTIVNNPCIRSGQHSNPHMNQEDDEKDDHLSREDNGEYEDRFEDFLTRYEKSWMGRSYLENLERSYLVLRENVTKQDVQWTTNKFVGGVRSHKRDELYEHFEVPEEDVEDIRGNLRKEESVVDEVYKVLNHGLRVREKRTREYLLRKLLDLNENLAWSFMDYLLEEMQNKMNRDAGGRKEEETRFSPPRQIQNKSTVKIRR